MAKKITPAAVITTHMNADFDALGSMVAASSLYPDAILLFPGSQEKTLRHFFLQSVMYLYTFYTAKEVDFSQVETLILVDTRQKSRLPHIEELTDRSDIRIHIYDHHPASDNDIYSPDAVLKPWGSTATIICHELMQRNVLLQEDQATVIGLGIYEDTGSFTFSSTTEHDFTAAAWLATQGMDFNSISEIIIRELSAEQISLLNLLLQNAKTYDIKGISLVITEVSTEEYVNDFALLVHKMLDMENITVFFALGRMGDRIQVVARSRNPEVNAGKICMSLGGGGHGTAASACVKDRTLAELKEELLALLYSHINTQHTVGKLMSSPAITVEADKTTGTAAAVMMRYGLKAIPIVDATGNLLGILDHQQADKAVSHGLEEVPVTEYMAPDPAVLTAEASLYEAIEIILGRGQRLLPVLENNKIAGILTRTDLIHLLIEEPARIPESFLQEKKQERSIRAMLHNRLPDQVYSLLQQIGHLADRMDRQVYAVGGFVRDILLGTPNLDLDLVVEGDGIPFAQALAKELGGHVRGHTKFRTAVIFLEDKQRIDVATARLEYYESPAALPVVELSSIKMDLYRRDFTVNSLAVHLNSATFGHLVDFFGAQRDIKKRLIRVLHSLAFVEDPTRILRAIRFANRFSFSIGKQTDRLIKNAVERKMIDKLTGARLFNELELIFEEEKSTACLLQMQQYGLLRAIEPALSLTARHKTLLEELDTILGWYYLLYLPDQPRLWLLYLFIFTHGLKTTHARALTTRLGLTAQQQKEFFSLQKILGSTLSRLRRWHTEQGPPSKLYTILATLPTEAVLFLMARSPQEELRRAFSLYLSRLKHLEPAISGADIRDLGIPEGPLYGQFLMQIHAALLDGKVTTRDQQLQMLQTLVDAHGAF